MIYSSDSTHVVLSVSLSLSKKKKEDMSPENHDSLRIYANWPVMIHFNLAEILHGGMRLIMSIMTWYDEQLGKLPMRLLLDTGIFNFLY